MAKAPKQLADLFHDTLKDVYFAEKKILTALPKMAKAAQNDDLRAAFEKHKDETEGQVELGPRRALELRRDLEHDLAQAVRAEHLENEA